MTDSTDRPDDEQPATSETTDTPDKLDEIEREIADVRHRLADEAGELGPHFADDGEADRGEPVDDSIAPG